MLEGQILACSLPSARLILSRCQQSGQILLVAAKGRQDGVYRRAAGCRHSIFQKSSQSAGWSNVNIYASALLLQSSRCFAEMNRVTHDIPEKLVGQAGQNCSLIATHQRQLALFVLD